MEHLEYRSTIRTPCGRPVVNVVRAANGRKFTIFFRGSMENMFNPKRNQLISFAGYFHG